MSEKDYALGEMDRRLANLLRFGTVSAVDAAQALARVDLGDLVTDWLPWLTQAAGQNRVWRAPSVGEQVVVVSPGDPSQGVIIGSVFQNAHPANGDNAKDTRATFADGTVVEYDTTAHQLLVDCSASNGAVTVNVGSGSVTVNCATATVNATDSVTLNTPSTHCTGDLTVDGNAQIAGDADITGNTTVTGNVQTMGALAVAMAITGAGGMAVSGGSGAAISGSMEITGGDVTVDGISLKGHGHIEQGDGARTSDAVA